MSGQTTNRTNCCVYGCSSRADRDKGLSFHFIPKQCSRTVKIVNKFGTEESVDIRKAWEKMLMSGKKLTNAVKVCSKHFLKEDHILPDIQCKKKMLKKNAVPSQNLPLQSSVDSSVQSRIERKKKRDILKETPTTSNSFCQSNEETFEIEANAESSKAVEVINDLFLSPSHLQTCKCDKSVQVKSGDFIIPFISLFDTNCKLNTATGIGSIKLLETIVSLFDKHDCAKRYRKLSSKERIILTFMKLKLDVSYVVLSILFHTISSQTSKDIFQETILYLSLILKPAIPWPSKEECLKNMPLCFKSYQDTRIIIDCIEMEIQKPKCLCCRVRTYSHYKGRHTQCSNCGGTELFF